MSRKQRNSGFGQNDQKATEVDLQRRKRTRSAVFFLLAVAVVGIFVFAVNTPQFYRNMTALNVDGQRFSITDMNYYASGNFSYDAAVQDARQRALLHRFAVEEGLTLDENAMAEIDTFMRFFHDEYAERGFRNANRFVLAQYGRGMNLRTLMERLEFHFLGQMYVDLFIERLHASFTEEMLEARYEENRENFERLYFRSYTIWYMDEDEMIGLSPEELLTALTLTDAQEIADTILTAAEEDGEAGFLRAVERSMTDLGWEDADADTHTWQDEPLATAEHMSFGDWLLAGNRAAGDTTVFEEAGSVSVVYFVTREDNRYYTTNVRHILLGFERDPQFGQPIPPTPEERVELEAEAERILAEWRSRGATEEDFIQLVREYSDDYRQEADPGFFGEIHRQSGFVPEFRAWAVDESRRPGDVEIVETMFGLHIMYFIDRNTEMYHRYALAQQEMTSEAFQEWLDEALAAQTWSSTFFSRLVTIPQGGMGMW